MPALMIVSAPSIPPLVQARGLRKVYQLRNVRVEAVRGIDLDLYPGEFVAIMGPSGCGKSTLLNLLAGLDEPTEGSITIDGIGLAHLDEGRRALLRRDRIGFVFQSYELLPLLTVAQNVEFPLALAGVAAQDRAQRARTVLTDVGLPGKFDAFPDELSGGQKQRVAIARTLVTGPSVIFADEPTGSLDSVTGDDILTLLRRASNANTTVVMVTHDQHDAQWADRIVRLRDGRQRTPEAA